MSTLEDEFFNLLETSDSRWTTLIIEGRTWSNIDLLNLAWQAQINRMKANGASFAVFQSSNSDENKTAVTAKEIVPVEHEQTWCLLASPERRRAKFEVGGGLVDVVIQGSTFWSNGPGRSITNRGKKNQGHGQGDGQDLIRTAEYAGLLHVVELSEGMRIGRHTLDAKVALLHNQSHERGQRLHGLTIGDADFLELSVDRERGVVLMTSSWFQGAVYRIMEMTKVEFDPFFTPDVFKIEPESGPEWTSL